MEADTSHSPYTWGHKEDTNTHFSIWTTFKSQMSEAGPWVEAESIGANWNADLVEWRYTTVWYLLERHQYLWLYIVSMVSCWWCGIWFPWHQLSVCRVTHLSPEHTDTHTLQLHNMSFVVSTRLDWSVLQDSSCFFCHLCVCVWVCVCVPVCVPVCVCVCVCVCVQCSPSPCQECERGRTACWGSGCILLSGPGWSAPGPLLPPSQPQDCCSLEGLDWLSPAAAAKPDTGPADTHSSSDTQTHTHTHKHTRTHTHMHWSG